jgi:hypothetical protein
MVEQDRRNDLPCRVIGPGGGDNRGRGSSGRAEGRERGIGWNWSIAGFWCRCGELSYPWSVGRED